MSKQEEPLGRTDDVDLASDAWIGPSQAARVGGVSVQRILALIHQGHVRAVRTAIGRLVNRADVEVYRRAREARVSSLGPARNDNEPRPAA